MTDCKNEYNENLKNAGFDLANLPPLYVIEKDAVKNRLVVGTREECLSQEFAVEKVHWINQITDDRLQITEVKVRIRHGGEWVNARLLMTDDGLRVKLEKPVFGVAPGQAAVFYLPAEASAKESEGEMSWEGESLFREWWWGK